MKMAGCTSGPWNSGFRARRRVLPLGAVLAAGLCLSAAAPAKVTSVRFWSLGEVTRVAIEVSSDFKYKSDRIPTPERLFFDIQGASPQMAHKGMYVIPVGDPLLKQIRVAETQPGVTRVVLDLEQQAGFTASQLSNPNRLMIELRAGDRPSPPATTSVTGMKSLSIPRCGLSKRISCPAEFRTRSRRISRPTPKPAWKRTSRPRGASSSLRHPVSRRRCLIRPRNCYRSRPLP